MYSDGLTDALNSTEEMFGITGLERAIENSSPDQRLNGIKDAVIQHIAGAEPRDDIALVVVSC
jgi:serine phosphatase RsbU (regulator of sigma subunit)